MAVDREAMIRNKKETLNSLEQALDSFEKELDEEEERLKGVKQPWPTNSLVLIVGWAIVAALVFISLSLMLNR